MPVIKKVYDLSPLFIQNAMTSLAGYVKNRTRYGKVYYEYLDFLKEFDSWSLDKKLDYQLNELIRFINYAVEKSKFYRELYKNYDISSIHSLDDLKQFPVVDKEMLRERLDEVVTIPRKGAVVSHTGGTTGKSLTVYFTPEDIMKRMALLDHFKLRVGFKHREMKRATFNGQHIVPSNQKAKVFWRYNSACRQMIYSSFYLSEENMKYYVNSLNKFKPHAIDGFFMSICDIAGYIERHDIKIEFQPIAIFPTSETLTKSGRELLERVFKCKVYDQYASSEGAPFVTECRNQVLHMELASGVIERYEDRNDEILVTSFTTHGTPLIRYRIGDSMTFGDSNDVCNCGLNAPIIRRIEGRRNDFLVTVDGARINHINSLLKDIPNAIIRAQAIQVSQSEIRLLLEVDKKIYKQEYDKLIERNFHNIFGYETRLTIEHVIEIPREKSGKFRMIKNDVINKDI